MSACGFAHDSGLAARAVVEPAAGNPGFYYFLATAVTGPAFPRKYPVPVLTAPEPLCLQRPGPDQVIGNPPLSVGLPGKLEDAGGQAVQFLDAAVGWPPVRMYAGNMETFAAQVIAHARKIALVQQ